jgi:hypothetical protein
VKKAIFSKQVQLFLVMGHENGSPNKPADHHDHDGENNIYFLILVMNFLKNYKNSSF